MYGTSIDPIPGLDPRWDKRSKLNRLAQDALRAAGVEPNFQSNDIAAVERHAEKMDSILAPLGRNALISKMHSL